MWAFLYYFLLYFPFTFADNITLSIEPAVPFNQTVTVAWNIVNGKPPKKWDIRLAQDKEDVGELLRSIQSSDSSGTADITITKANETGHWFILLAVKADPKNKSNFKTIGNSSYFQIVDQESIASSAIIAPPSASTSTSANTQVTMPANYSGQHMEPQAGAGTLAAMRSDSHSKTGTIVGATIGGVVFILVAVGLLAFYRRRRHRARVPSQVVFNRELMFQRRPTPNDSWTLRSADLEKGALAQTPRAYVPRTTTSDRDSASDYGTNRNQISVVEA